MTSGGRSRIDVADTGHPSIDGDSLPIARPGASQHLVTDPLSPEGLHFQTFTCPEVPLLTSLYCGLSGTRTN